MEKRTFPKPGNFVYPVPPAMVSLRDGKGHTNILTIAWTGTVCSDPPMVSISVRKERHSHAMLAETREFVLNLPDASLVRAADYCGCVSGRDVDKFAACRLTPAVIDGVSAPAILEAPVSIACRVREILPLGSHDMFLAEVVSVQAAERYFDERGGFHMERAGLVAYSHGAYHELGRKLGTFGFSVRKKPAGKRR